MRVVIDLHWINNQIAELRKEKHKHFKDSISWAVLDGRQQMLEELKLKLEPLQQYMEYAYQKGADDFFQCCSLVEELYEEDFEKCKSDFLKQY